MVTLADAIQVLFPNSVSLTDWVVADDGSGPKIIYWNAGLGSQPTQEQLNAVTDAQVTAWKRAKARSIAKVVIDGLGGYESRGLVSLLIDEINVLRQRDRDRSADIAASTSLANLQTRWAARSALNDRTLAQAKTAYKTLMDGTNLDE